MSKFKEFRNSFFNKEKQKETVNAIYLEVGNDENIEIEVTDEQMRNLPDVLSAKSEITNAISQLPIYVYKEDKKGNVKRVRGHKLEEVLNERNNPIQDACNFKSNIVDNIIDDGCHISYIERNDYGQVVGLYNVDVISKEIEYNQINGLPIDVSITYKINDVQNEMKKEDAFIVARDSKDGLNGKAILSSMDILELAAKQNVLLENVFNNLSAPKIVYETPGTLTQEQINAIKTEKEKYKGKGLYGVDVVYGGMKVKTLNLNLDTINLNENKREFAREIRTIFGLEGIQTKEERLTKVIQPIITLIENAINNSLLTLKERKDGYYVRFDTSELLRASEKEIYETMEIGMRCGILSRNESRAKIDKEPLPNDYMVHSLGDVFYDIEKGNFFIPNTGQDTGQDASKKDGGTEDVKEGKI